MTEAYVDVRLRGSKRRQHGCLTDRDVYCAQCGGVAVLIGQDAHPPIDVDEVRIFGDCTVELLDAAIEAGYWVTGKTSRRAEA